MPTKIKEELIKKANEENIPLDTITIEIDNKYISLVQWEPNNNHRYVSVKYKINKNDNEYKNPIKVNTILKLGFLKNKNTEKQGRKTKIKQKLIDKANEEKIPLDTITIEIDNKYISLDEWEPLAIHNKCNCKYKINNVEKKPKKVGTILLNGFLKGKTRSDKEWRKHIIDNNPGYKIITKETIINNKKRIKLMCPKGHIWDVTVEGCINGQCTDCYKLNRGKRRKENCAKKFKEKVAKDNPKVEILGEYKGSHEKVECKCKICSHKWPAPATHLFGKSPTGCPKCGQVRANIASSFTTTEFMDLVNKYKLPHILIPPNFIYQPSSIKLGIKYGYAALVCQKHGPFICTTDKLRSGILCPNCGKGGISSGESHIINYLENKRIGYVHDKQCDDPRCGRLDFQGIKIRNMNIVIEYDGYPMHFDYTNQNSTKYICFKLSKKKAVINFIGRQIMDKKKNYYCMKQDNTILIRVPYNYNTQNKIHNFLDNIFNNIENQKQKIIYADRQIYINHAIKMGKVNCAIKTLQRKVLKVINK
tara:strand:+ start:43253 stop:44854 length:1602 start_codon:yes stop_codon:yes gene_type:complete